MIPEQELQLAIFGFDNEIASDGYQNSVTVDLKLEIGQFEKLESV
jgi:hypothetical protein